MEQTRGVDFEWKWWVGGGVASAAGAVTKVEYLDGKSDVQ